MNVIHAWLEKDQSSIKGPTDFYYTRTAITLEQVIDETRQTSQSHNLGNRITSIAFPTSAERVNIVQPRACP